MKKGGLANALSFYCSRLTKENNTTSWVSPFGSLWTIALKSTVYVIASED